MRLREKSSLNSKRTPDDVAPGDQILFALVYAHAILHATLPDRPSVAIRELLPFSSDIIDVLECI